MQKSRKTRTKSITNSQSTDSLLSPTPSPNEEKVVDGPAPAPSVGELPTSLTFFLSTDERRLVLKKLKRLNRDRRTALLRALRIDNAKTTLNQGAHRG